jgi:type II secretion system protein N
MGPDIIAGSASIMLFGRDVRAMPVNALPPLELGAVRVKLVLEQGVATLQDVSAKGSDGDLTANGTVAIAQDIAQSTIQLTLSLRPSAKAWAGFGFFLHMLPHSPNQGPYHLQGMLRSPSLS